MAFFANDVPITEEISRGGSRVEVQRKGSLRVFEDWLRQNFRVRGDGDVIGKVFEPLKLVRKLRQKPAHALHPEINTTALYGNSNVI